VYVNSCCCCRDSNCSDSQLQLYTLRPPVVYGDCRGLVFSPHCAQYPGLHAHLAQSGLTGMYCIDSADVGAIFDDVCFTLSSHAASYPEAGPDDDEEEEENHR
jgi:hypothetical protein